MSAVAIAAGAAVLGSGYKIYSGEKQISDSKKLAKNNIFTPQQMPGEVKVATNLAADNYYNGMPGMSMAQTSIDRNAANAIYNGSQGASSGGDVLDLAARVNQNENNAEQDLAAKAAEYRVQALGGYVGALNNEAQWQDRLYQNNIKEPYQQKAATASAMYGAGNINLANGIDGLGTAAATFASTLSDDYDPNSQSTSDASRSRNTNLFGVSNPDMSAAMAMAKHKKFSW